ncbi:MAG: STAS domain-containing protein [Leptospiraceae bacterium]|nr:STAS domain-containing protein [Leptospiraceae bacterium]MCP5511382.1 STAS domain-containing protein [Leptospiraceae bacterium]
MLDLQKKNSRFLIDQVRILHKEKIIIFHLSGNIEINTAKSIETESNPLYSIYPDYDTVLNLENTGLISSSGFSIFIKMIKDKSKVNLEVKFCCLSPENRKVLEIMELGSIIKNFLTEEECIEYFRTKRT